jgi:DNA-binding CsgD family transcriptional regulator
VADELDNGQRVTRPMPLGRFDLAGHSWLIMPLAGEPGTPDHSVGMLRIEDRCYAVIEAPQGPSAMPQDILTLLTPRELDVAVLVAAGQDAKSIARRLQISFYTVRIHLGRIYAKLGMHKQTELAARIAARFAAPLDLSPERANGCQVAAICGADLAQAEAAPEARDRAPRPRAD